MEFHNTYYPGISQDAWIFTPPIPKKICADFTLGCPGCDNRIAAEFNKAGWILSNPSKLIKCYHLHISAIRNYGDAVSGPHISIPYSELP